MWEKAKKLPSMTSMEDPVTGIPTRGDLWFTSIERWLGSCSLDQDAQNGPWLPTATAGERPHVLLKPPLCTRH